MRTVPFVLLALLFGGALPSRSLAAETEGVALAIIYDTSGSMREVVPSKDGKTLPKYVVANRALREIAKQLQAFSTNGATARKIDVGLFIFKGNGAREVVKLGPLDAEALDKWARSFNRPEGGTPLGNALSAATHAVLASPLPHKHVLVITDGINTVGADPSKVMPGLKKQAEQQQSAFSVHFVAFDVDAGVFDGVKKLGATVVGAADEKQLDSQLQFILQRKILLEEEEPRKTSNQ